MHKSFCSLKDVFSDILCCVTVGMTTSDFTLNSKPVYFGPEFPKDG